MGSKKSDNSKVWIKRQHSVSNIDLVVLPTKLCLILSLSDISTVFLLLVETFCNSASKHSGFMSAITDFNLSASILKWVLRSRNFDIENTSNLNNVCQDNNHQNVFQMWSLQRENWYTMSDRCQTFKNRLNQNIQLSSYLSLLKFFFMHF